MKITVVGTGYVGLVSGTVFADWGHEVTCLDIDEKKIENLKNGIMPIYEVGLEEIVKRNLDKGSLQLTTDKKLAFENSEAIFICVGTPSSKTGSADLSFVFGVAKDIAEFLPENQYTVVICKSTVPVGTNLKVKEEILKNSNGKKLDFDVLSNPEFLREGEAVKDSYNQDRVVIGSDSEKALSKIETLYTHLNVPIVKTDLASAELIKYASNSFVATKIGFINEMARVCDLVGANVKEVAYGMGLDDRIGKRYLFASLGFGGSCFPKDIRALYRLSSEKHYDFRILRGVIESNEDQKKWFANKITNHFGSNLSGMTIGILGMAFKAETDDLRESPAITAIEHFRGHGAKLKVHDYQATSNAKKYFGESMIEYCEKPEDTFEDVDILVLLTEWKGYKELNLASLAPKLRKKAIFDGRNILDRKVIESLGLEYFGVGI